MKKWILSIAIGLVFLTLTRSQATEFFLAPCFRMQIDTSQMWAGERKFDLPSYSGEFAFRRIESEYLYVRTYQTGEDLIFPTVIESWDSLQFIRQYEGTLVTKRMLNGFHIAEITKIMDECSTSDYEVFLDTDPLIEFFAWKIVHDDIIIFFSGYFKASNRQKTDPVVNDLLSKVELLEIADMDNKFNLPWNTVEATKRKKECIDFYYQKNYALFKKSLECSEEGYYLYTLGRAFGKELIDSLEQTNDFAQLSHLYAKLTMKEFMPKIEAYFKDVADAQFSFNEAHSLKARIMNDDWSVDQIARFYFDRNNSGELKRACELQIFDSYPTKMSYEAMEPDFDNGLELEYSTGSYISENEIDWLKFNTIFINAIQREVFQDKRIVDWVHIHPFGTVNFIELHLEFDTSSNAVQWLGVIERNAAGKFEIRKLNMAFEKDEFESNYWYVQNSLSDDFLVIDYKRIWDSKVISYYQIMNITNGISSWESLELIAMNYNSQTPVVVNMIQFESAIPQKYYNWDKMSIDLEKLDKKLLDKAIDGILLSEANAIRDTLPDAGQEMEWNNVWIEAVPGKFVLASALYPEIENLVEVEMKLFCTELLFEDLNGDGIDEIFYFTVQNGELRDFKIFTSQNGSIVDVSNAKWKKLLKKSDYFINLSHHSMIGRHGG